jgi:ubiquinone/menaquinone biosynthesis C-methylase UbiE
VYGLDILIGMLRQCLKDLKKFKCEAELFLENAEELPFGNKSFDAVKTVSKYQSVRALNLCNFEALML